MKYFSFLTLVLLLICAACSDEKTNSDSTKKVDKPNFEQTAKPTTASKEDNAQPPRVPSTPEELEKAKSIIAAISPEDVAALDGKNIFKMYCAACHGFTGDLNVNGATDLTKSTIALEERVAQVYHGRGLMTPFKGLLKDAQIVAVAKYVEDLRK